MDAETLRSLQPFWSHPNNQGMKPHWDAFALQFNDPAENPDVVYDRLDRQRKNMRESYERFVELEMKYIARLKPGVVEERSEIHAGIIRYMDKMEAVLTPLHQVLTLYEWERTVPFWGELRVQQAKGLYQRPTWDESGVQEALAMASDGLKHTDAAAQEAPKYPVKAPPIPATSKSARQDFDLVFTYLKSLPDDSQAFNSFEDVFKAVAHSQGLRYGAAETEAERLRKAFYRNKENWGIASYPEDAGAYLVKRVLELGRSYQRG